MFLTLAIAGKELASIPIDASRATCHQYLQTKRRLLLMTKEALVHQQEESPIYYIKVGSKMNKGKRG